ATAAAAIAIVGAAGAGAPGPEGSPMRRKFLMWVSLAVGLWAGSWAGAWMAPWAPGGAAFWMAPGSSAAWAASASARPGHPVLRAGTAAEADWGQQLRQELLAGAGPGPAVE